MSERPLSTKIMAILNVTPDSFSDGGRFHLAQDALAQADRLIAEGADILDIGGESTRPYAEPVGLEEELARTIPVITAVRSRHAIPISIDTTKAEVARQALAAGADIVNDISALYKDGAMVDVAAAGQSLTVRVNVAGKTPAGLGLLQGTPFLPGTFSAAINKVAAPAAGD